MVHRKMSLPRISRERVIGHANAFTTIKFHTRSRAKQFAIVMQVHWGSARYIMQVFKIYSLKTMVFLMMNPIQIIIIVHFLPNVCILLTKYLFLFSFVLIDIDRIRAQGILMWHNQEV